MYILKDGNRVLGIKRYIVSNRKSQKVWKLKIGPFYYIIQSKSKLSHCISVSKYKSENIQNESKKTLKIKTWW